MVGDGLAMVLERRSGLPRLRFVPRTRGAAPAIDARLDRVATPPQGRHLPRRRFVVNCRVKISLAALVTLSACGDVVDESPMQVSISVALPRAARSMPGCALDAPDSR